MNTILDTCKTIFLNKLNYLSELHIEVSEGFIENETQSIQIGFSKIEDLKRIKTNNKSRIFKIIFNLDGIINFQVIDESYACLNQNELKDSKGFIQIIKNSKYLEYIDSNHGFYREVLDEKAKHYRIWTEDDIIDVISLKDPKISEIEKSV